MSMKQAINKATDKHIVLGNSLNWRINTPQFLKEVFENQPGMNTAIFYQPVNIFRIALMEVADRASEINDPILNGLMCKLSLYGVSDPYDKGNYNHEKLTEVMNSPEYTKWRKQRKSN